MDVHAGDYLRLSVAQHGTDVGVRLLTPDGETLVDVGYRQDEPKVVSAVVQTSGDYRLEIRSLETSPITGRYMAQVQQHRMAGEGDVDRVLADQLFNEAETLSIAKADPGPLLPRSCVIAKHSALWRAARDGNGQAKSARRLGEALHFDGKSEAALAQLLDSLAVSHLAADAEGGERCPGSRSRGVSRSRENG